MRRLLILGLLLIPQACACSCVMLMSRCDRAWSAGESIFVGTVAALDGADAHFTAQESFRGNVAAGSEIVIHSDGSNCNYPFVAGSSYIVYATKDPRDGLLYTSRCSETRPVAMTSGAMRELRALRDHARPDGLFGTIGVAAGGGDLGAWIQSRPLPGITVRAVDSKGKSYSDQTDTEGAYSFASLPAGSYKIEPDLPAGFAHPPELIADVSGGTSCRVDLFAATDGQIEGTVVDASGNPVAGFVTIRPADPKQSPAGLPGYDVAPDGVFKLPNLPPGRYRLTYRPKNNFRAAYSGLTIDLRFGEHLVIQFKVP
jgi:hypothetical protein